MVDADDPAIQEMMRKSMAEAMEKVSAKQGKRDDSYRRYWEHLSDDQLLANIVGTDGRFELRRQQAEGLLQGRAALSSAQAAHAQANAAEAHADAARSQAHAADIAASAAEDQVLMAKRQADFLKDGNQLHAEMVDLAKSTGKLAEAQAKTARYIFWATVVNAAFVFVSVIFLVLAFYGQLYSWQGFGDTEITELPAIELND